MPLVLNVCRWCYTHFIKRETVTWVFFLTNLIANGRCHELFVIFILFNLDAVIKSCVFFLVTNVRLLNALNVNLMVLNWTEEYNTYQNKCTSSYVPSVKATSQITSSLGVLLRDTVIHGRRDTFAALTFPPARQSLSHCRALMTRALPEIMALMYVRQKAWQVKVWSW